MIIRADTNDPEKVPEVGATFQVVKTTRNGSWWVIELIDKEG